MKIGKTELGLGAYLGAGLAVALYNLNRITNGRVGFTNLQQLFTPQAYDPNYSDFLSFSTLQAIAFWPVALGVDLYNVATTDPKFDAAGGSAAAPTPIPASSYIPPGAAAPPPGGYPQPGDPGYDYTKTFSGFGVLAFGRKAPQFVHGQVESQTTSNAGKASMRVMAAVGVCRQLTAAGYQALQALQQQMNSSNEGYIQSLNDMVSSVVSNTQVCQASLLQGDMQSAKAFAGEVGRVWEQSLIMPAQPGVSLASLQAIDPLVPELVAAVNNASLSGLGAGPVILNARPKPAPMLGYPSFSFPGVHKWVEVPFGTPRAVQGMDGRWYVKAIH